MQSATKPIVAIDALPLSELKAAITRGEDLVAKGVMPADDLFLNAVRATLKRRLEQSTGETTARAI